MLVGHNDDDVRLDIPVSKLSEGAVHEAGHAVTGELLGLRVTVVEIADGRLRCKCARRPIDDRQDALYTLAGEKAENEILGSWGETPLAQDDRAGFRGLGPGAPDSNERRLWREAIELEASNIVRSARVAIEEVARQLAQPPFKLSGPEVRRIMKAMKNR